MNAELERRDAESRARALDLTASFIVQAPAGAGKTELLTQRFLGLLATVEAPEQIVAITFTRKAAAEMKHRILTRLKEAGDVEPTEAHKKTSWQLARQAVAHDATQGWALADNPERLRVTTIDALCASLVRQMPYLSRFGGMPRIGDRPSLHYEEAARRTVAAVEDLPAVARALASLDNDGARLRRLLVTMLAFREQWLPHVHGLRGGDPDARKRLGDELTANLARLVARELAGLAEAFAGRQDVALMAAARYVAASQPIFAALADWDAPLAAMTDDLPRWQALAALLLTGEGQPRKQFNAKIGLPASDATAKAHAADLKAVTAWLETDEAALDALQGATRCPLPRYAAADLDAIETFAEVLVLAAANLWLVFQENGETDFAAVAERALEALGCDRAPTDLALRLDYAIRHLLVDEFQDTNPQQIALLEKLSAGWQGGDARTLFVVGDPMQSIYRFRKADVGLFLRAWTGGIGGIELEALSLYRNNRSTPAIVDWVNLTFAQVFPAVPDAERGRVAYAHAIATRAEDEGAVTVHPILVPKDGTEDGAAKEATTILAIVDATRRARPAADIAVLVRARDHLAPLVAALRRERPDIRYEAVEIESLAARQPIQDLLALTRALDHRADRVNWLAILRAPWCGLTLADLHELSKVGAGRTATEPTIWSSMNDDARCASLSEDGQTRLAHLREALRPLIDAPGRLDLRRTVETAWRRLGGERCLTSASDRADVAAFFALLDRLAAGGRVDMARLEQEVAELYAAPSSDAQAGRLKFMTIHKSKGLEFDTVILPGLHRRGGRNDTRLLSWDSAQDEDGNHRLVVSPCRLVEDDDESRELQDEGRDIRRYIETLEAARADQEMRRLLYVAATRAKRRLHLLAVQQPKREAMGYVLAEPKKFEGTPCHILWPALREHFIAALAEIKAASPGDVSGAQGLAGFVPRLQRLPLAALPAMPVKVAVPQPQGEETIAAEQEIFTGSALAPLVGTLVHRYLELIAGAGIDQWDAARVATCRLACEKWLRGRGCDAATSRRGAQRVVHALTQAVSSERGRWILRPRAEAACELAMTQHADDVWRNHVVDRSFVEDGVRWIIDYKTGAHEGGDAESFIAVRHAEYAPQLARYAELFAHEGRPLRQALYFVDLDRFVELTSATVE